MVLEHLEARVDKARVSIPSLLSAVAVVISLTFVGFEIRQNTAAQQSAMIEGITSQRVEFNIASFADDRIPDLVLRAREGAVAADFSPVETQTLRLWFIAYLRIVESAHRQIGVGVIGEDALNTFASTILGWPLFTEQWPTLQLSFEPGFIEFLEPEFIP